MVGPFPNAALSFKSGLRWVVGHGAAPGIRWNGELGSGAGRPCNLLWVTSLAGQARCQTEIDAVVRPDRTRLRPVASVDLDQPTASGLSGMPAAGNTLIRDIIARMRHAGGRAGKALDKQGQ